MADYASPVDQLLRLGAIDWSADWLNYRQFGLGPEHAAELARLAADPVWRDEEADETLAWAPLHAWRALAQLGALEQLPVMVEQMRLSEDMDTDLITEEFPDVLARFGPPAVPVLISILNDEGNGLWTRMAARAALEKIGVAHPEQREAIVAALTDVLARGASAEPEFNGFIISALLELKAVEAAPVMEAAFASGWVDETIAGDWPEVLFALGLGPKPPSRHRPPTSLSTAGPSTPRARAEDRKAQRKRERQARKRNRKRR